MTMITVTAMMSYRFYSCFVYAVERLSCAFLFRRFAFLLSVCCSQAMFAGFIPEIMDILSRRSKYGGSYKKERGKR